MAKPNTKLFGTPMTAQKLLELMELGYWTPIEGNINESEDEFEWVNDIKLSLGFDDLKLGDVVRLKDYDNNNWEVIDIYMSDPRMTGKPSEKRIKFKVPFKNSRLELWKSPLNSEDYFELVNFDPFNHLHESEDDFEWAEDITSTNPTYRFSDLVFKPHRLPGAVRARLNFPNGHYISVVGGPGLYGDGIDTFEIWRSDQDDVQGYLSKGDVTQEMLELQELPPLEGGESTNNNPWANTHSGPITETDRS